VAQLWETTFGNRSDIERVPVENLRAFYRKFYQPDNVVLVVAGKFDEAKALGWVQKYFGRFATRTQAGQYLDRRAGAGRRTGWYPCGASGDVGAIGVAYHIPGRAARGQAALQVLANILSNPTFRPALPGTGPNPKSRKAPPRLAAEKHDPGLMTIQAEVTREASLEEVRDLIIATVEPIGAQGVTAEEVKPVEAADSQTARQAATDTTDRPLAQ